MHTFPFAQIKGICHGMSLLILLGMSCVVRGSKVIEAVPGQNVSLPCVFDQMNDQQTVKWWRRHVYISSGKEVLDNLGPLKEFYVISGEGTDYSLLIMIPEDIDIWEYHLETYKCRLVSNIDDTYSLKTTVNLHIYQPATMIPLQQHTILNIQKDPTKSSGGCESNHNRGSIINVQFIIAIGSSTAFLILLLFEICRCCRKRVNNTSGKSTKWPQTTDVSNQASCGANFFKSWRGNQAHQQAKNDIALSENSQDAPNTPHHTHQTKGNSAFYDEIDEALDAGRQMGSIGNVSYVNCDVDNEDYLEIIA